MSDECICFVTPEHTWFRYGSAVEPGSQMEWNPRCPAHPPARSVWRPFLRSDPGRIRILFSVGGSLPDGVAARSGEKPVWGWYAITPNGVAHWVHNSAAAFALVRGWLHNFGNDPDFWSTAVHPEDRKASG